MKFPRDYIWQIGYAPNFVAPDGLVYCEDAIKILCDLPSESVDLVVTDPPYGISYRSLANDAINRKNRADRTKSASSLSVTGDTPNRASLLFNVLVYESERILRPGGTICCFAQGGGPNTIFADWIQIMAKVLQFKQALIWDKRRIGCGGHYRKQYEFILIAKKRGRACTWNGGYSTANILSFKRPRPGPGTHPTPKPVGILAKLISIHSNPGDLVLDPFCGHGSTLIAARLTSRKFLGVEIAPEYCEFAACSLE